MLLKYAHRRTRQRREPRCCREPACNIESESSINTNTAPNIAGRNIITDTLENNEEEIDMTLQCDVRTYVKNAASRNTNSTFWCRQIMNVQ